MTRDDRLAPVPPAFSVYLDLLRFGAAAMVLLFHIKKFEFGPAAFRALIPDKGHDFVILFFVLSGYVIASAADRKRALGLRTYVLDRMARVYSVAIPVLVFCTVLALTVPRWIDPQAWWPLESDHALALIPLNFFFLGESWWLRLMPFANYPYWSLTYEVTYYALFGALLFTTGAVRIVAMAVIAAIAGPKILLLLPCWAAGALAYYARDGFRPRPAVALAIAFVLPPVVLVVLNRIGFGPATRGLIESMFPPDKYDLLDVSQAFLVDYMTSALVAVHLFAMRFVPFTWNERVERLLRALAGFSFTLYLMHHPLLCIIAASYLEARSHVTALLLAVFAVPLICFVVSRYTEEKRGTLRRWLELPWARRAPAIREA